MVDVAGQVGEQLSQLQQIYRVITEFAVKYGIQVVGAVIILLIGLWLSARLARWVRDLMARRGIDVTLTRFASGVTRLLILVCFLVISLGKIGISVTPFVAAIGAIGLGAGLAVQGLLSNYSAGLAIVVTRPFVVDDTISVSGVSGQVREIKLAATILVTEDREEITVPNKHIIGEILKNSFDQRIVETSVGISYGDSPTRAIEVISEAVSALGCVASEPAPMVGIDAFGESSIDIGIRVWVPTARYFQSRYEIHAAVFDAIGRAGLTIPFPQRDVNLRQQV